MIRRIVLLFCFLTLSVITLGQNTAYCNIESIDVQQLSNGVQIIVKADGVLRIEDDYGGSYSSTKRSIQITNAKSKIGKSFIDVSKYPVSYIQLAVMQNASEGVGIDMTVALFEASSVSVQVSNDRQSIIVTANSSRTLSKQNGKGSGGAGAKADKSYSVEANDGKLSIFAVKANVRKLLADIARKAKISIAIDDSLKDRETSMVLTDATLEEALKAITDGSGLAISKEKDVYMVTDGVPQDLATYHLSNTESFAMSNVKAQVASGLLPTFLYSFLHVNDAQNAVVVTAPKPMLDKIRTDFEKIDVAPPQIMIEALAVEVSSTNDFAAGMNLTYTNSANNGAMDTITGDISYSTIGSLPADFRTKLNALVSAGKAKVRATPRMAALNGRYAELFIGETKFIKVQVSSYGTVYDRIQGVDVGVTLKVMPWTGGNDEITTLLIPEVSNISEVDRQSGLPVLSTRKAQTTVRVKDGETIMIGGLVQTQDYDTTVKVPFLGDIPLLGNIFRSKSKSHINSELVIFVTPHILTPEGRLKDEKKEQEIRERFGQAK